MFQCAQACASATPLVSATSATGATPRRYFKALHRCCQLGRSCGSAINFAGSQGTLLASAGLAASGLHLDIDQSGVIVFIVRSWVATAVAMNVTGLMRKCKARWRPPRPCAVQRSAQLAAKFCAEQDATACTDINNRKLGVYCFCKPALQPTLGNGSEGVSVFVYTRRAHSTQAAGRDACASRNFLDLYVVVKVVGALWALKGPVEAASCCGQGAAAACNGHPRVRRCRHHCFLQTCHIV